MMHNVVTRAELVPAGRATSVKVDAGGGHSRKVLDRPVVELTARDGTTVVISVADLQHIAAVSLDEEASGEIALRDPPEVT